MIIFPNSEEHYDWIKSQLLACVSCLQKDTRLGHLQPFLVFLYCFFQRMTKEELCLKLKKSILDQSDTLDDVTHYYCHNSVAKAHYKDVIAQTITPETLKDLNHQFTQLKSAVLMLTY